MSKPVTSHDPRKENIVSEFKARFGATKVTMVREDRKAGVFTANLMKTRPGYRDFIQMGHHSIPRKDAVND